MRRLWRSGRGWLVLALLAVTPAAGAAQTAAGQEPTISLSQNPLRRDSVTFRWTPAGSGPEQVFVYSLLGTPVARAILQPATGRWAWDGTAGDLAVANGAYLVVVTRGDGRRMRRRLIVAR